MKAARAPTRMDAWMTALPTTPASGALRALALGAEEEVEVGGADRLLLDVVGAIPVAQAVVRLVALDRHEAHGRGALTMGQLRTLEQRTGRPGLTDMLTMGHSLVLFDAPLAEVENVRFPWYYFGGGMKLTVSGHPYRFSFLQPQNTQTAPAHVAGIGSGRAGGRAWKSALAAV